MEKSVKNKQERKFIKHTKYFSKVLGLISICSNLLTVLEEGKKMMIVGVKKNILLFHDKRAGHFGSD